MLAESHISRGHRGAFRRWFARCKGFEIRNPNAQKIPAVAGARSVSQTALLLALNQFLPTTQSRFLMGAEML